MKRFLLIFLVIPCQMVFASTDSTATETKPLKWKLLNKAGLDLSEVTFVNWSAGGSNSISALTNVLSTLKYRKDHLKWTSSARLRYGINKQESQRLRKTEDEFELSSSLGYRKDTITNWYYSSRFNFRTQLTNGYNYPDRDNEISRLMAPGYMFIGGGVEYGKNLEQLTFYFSPITFKATFVLDQTLADSGAFGVNPATYDEEGNVIEEGENMRTEMGVLLTNYYETKVYDNIFLKHNLSVYSDYINDFGNLDIDWEVVFDFKVNDFVRASLGSHIKYDNDIKTFEEVEGEEEPIERGARIQWKQLLGVGVAFDF
ncbi:DUF3078 domain-containing protein [Psychroserpens sp. XS_ASV72]|uniref:DUF3078 domain-containing protein n=1 Tax=Psychroserpens sp. XS_ASV72 TaxID=3241293 RepID=UPI003515FC25